MKEKKKDRLLPRPVFILLHTLSLSVFCVSLWQLTAYFLEKTEEKSFNQTLVESTVTPVSWTEKDDEEKASLFQTEEGVGKDDYFCYPDISVDITKLKAQYPNAIGWLYSPDTPIHYPVMQAQDNDYYVNHLANGKENSAGSVFMDCSSDASLNDFFHILYGHNMQNGTMFGTILDYRKEGYFSDHPYLFYFTDSEIYRLEVFAGINTVADSDYYKIPQGDSAKEAYIKSARERSYFYADIPVGKEDSFMLLSTCSGSASSDARFLLFAKIVPISQEIVTE